MKILALCGSLRAQSSNRSVLLAAQKIVAGETQIVFLEIGDLPHFNPDLDGETSPEKVAEFRAQLNAADGVLMSTPEYAHGLPGTFKNALDWTVSSGEWMEKPTLILKTSRSHFAHDSLVEILTTIMAKISVCAIELSGNKMDAAAMLGDEKIAATLRAALDDFAAQFHKK